MGVGGWGTIIVTFFLGLCAGEGDFFLGVLTLVFVLFYFPSIRCLDVEGRSFRVCG